MVGRNSAAGGKMLLLDPIRRGCAAAGSFLVGTWLSLVEHSLGVRGVGSSNLPVPTILLIFFSSVSEFGRCFASSHFANCAKIVTLSSDSTALRFASCRMCELDLEIRFDSRIVPVALGVRIDGMYVNRLKIEIISDAVKIRCMTASGGTAINLPDYAGHSNRIRRAERDDFAQPRRS
jgi:hypothetical protein